MTDTDKQPGAVDEVEEAADKIYRYLNRSLPHAEWPSRDPTDGEAIRAFIQSAIDAATAEVVAKRNDVMAELAACKSNRQRADKERDAALAAARELAMALRMTRDLVFGVQDYLSLSLQPDASEDASEHLNEVYGMLDGPAERAVINQGQTTLTKHAILLAEPSDEPEEPTGCGYYGPHFGGGYDDAVCIDGYLWDLDSCDEPGGALHNGGDIPCPKCNTDKWNKMVAENSKQTIPDAG